MTRDAEPEREMVRRILPFAPLALVAAFGLGAAAGGWNVAWSAAIGVAVVVVNFAANGVSVAWAARISLQALYAVAMFGFVVRMGLILALLFLLDRLDFFSPLAFLLAVVPATCLILVFEMRMLAGGVGAGFGLGVSQEGRSR